MPDAVLERSRWRTATLVGKRRETPIVTTLSLDVPGWSGHLAGQHVDVRLTADDGYQAERSYSIASAAGGSERIDLTIEEVADGEVSPFLVNEFAVGDTLELRGPVGGYFTWRPYADRPLVLIGGGSGVVPLASILRTRAASDMKPATTLLYSVRHAEDLIYRREFERPSPGLTLVPIITRGAPDGWSGESRRIDRQMMEDHLPPVEETPIVFICGPTRFVEVAAELIAAIGHRTTSIKTERFGPAGET